MTTLAHWVLEDTNIGAETCASRVGALVLDLSGASGLAFRDTYIPDGRDSVATRKVLDMTSVTGGGSGWLATCHDAELFSQNGRIVFDVMLRLANGVSFVVQLVDSETSGDSFLIDVDIEDGEISVNPHHYVAGVTGDNTTRSLRFKDYGVAKPQDLALFTVEVDATSGTPIFTSYLNGERIGRLVSSQACVSRWTSGIEDFRIANNSSATLNYLCEIRISDDAVTLGSSRTTARFARWLRRALPALPILDPLASTSLLLSGNDYVEKETSWFDRSLSGNNAVAVGASSITTRFSPHFVGRQAIKGAASCGFYAAGDTLTGATERTYEVVLDSYGPEAAEMIIGRVSDTTTQHAFFLYKNNNGTVLSAVWPSDGFGSGFDHIHMGGGYTEPSEVFDLPVIFHVVVDTPNQAIQVWRNGVQLVQASDPLAGSLGALASTKLGILGKFNTATNTFDAGEFFTGWILEVARHEELFTPAMIAERCARFNELKGY